MSEEMPPPILVTGAARSGTSMTAGIIANSGAFGGNMLGPNPNNRKGMFENGAIREQVIKHYFREAGADPMGQFPLPDPYDLPPFADLGHIMEAIMWAEGYQEGPWFYKGAKLCLIWPVVHLAFPKAKWIIVRRSADDIVRSCMKTRFMRAFDSEEGWWGWVDHHLECFQDMKEAGLDVTEVWPSEFVAGDFRGIAQTVNDLGLTFDLKFATKFVDKKLWKGK